MRSITLGAIIPKNSKLTTLKLRVVQFYGSTGLDSNISASSIISEQCNKVVKFTSLQNIVFEGTFRQSANLLTCCLGLWLWLQNFLQNLRSFISETTFKRIAYKHSLFKMNKKTLSWYKLIAIL